MLDPECLFTSVDSPATIRRHPATPTPWVRGRGASALTRRSYRAGSFSVTRRECGRLPRKGTPDLWQVHATHVSEATRNTRSQARRWPILFQRMAKQFPGFFFHGTAMTRRPQAQPRPQRIVDVPYGQACHKAPNDDLNDVTACSAFIAWG